MRRLIILKLETPRFSTEGVRSERKRSSILQKAGNDQKREKK